ncbi:MAG TPA: MFS transporter [Pseudolabrys sp.]|nr:MFS transporter [Pseudolabrys sp.]
MSEPAIGPSQASARGLDWFVFFLADVQTGFGPFVAVYLTTQKWTQVEIGLVLSVSGLVALLGQMPGGAIVDWARSERMVATVAVALIGVSAAAYAAWPIFPAILLAAILHAGSSCVLGPAIAAISLGLVGRAGIGHRLGRNARFASLGSGIAAAAMGTVGYLWSSRAVFLVTVVLALPTLLALWHIRAAEIDPEYAHGSLHAKSRPPRSSSLAMLARNRPLLLFSSVLLLFHLANAAMLPLVGSFMTAKSSTWAPALIGACMVVPQIVVAAISPWVGTRSHIWGRRPLLLIGIAALVLRGLLFAFVHDPRLLVAVQIFDGVAASIFSVLVPLIVADVTFGTGHFNLAQGIVGTAVGIGASVSTVLAGYLTDQFGRSTAFTSLAFIAILALAVVWFAMPETRPPEAEVHEI